MYENWDYLFCQFFSETFSIEISVFSVSLSHVISHGRGTFSIFLFVSCWRWKALFCLWHLFRFTKSLWVKCLPFILGLIFVVILSREHLLCISTFFILLSITKALKTHIYLPWKLIISLKVKSIHRIPTF